jgi:hypothetical protein
LKGKLMRIIQHTTIALGVLLCQSLLTPATAQDAVGDRAASIINETLFSQEQIRVPIVLLGTFHFQDAGLDSFKPQHSVDVSSPKRQQEIEEIVDRLAAFGPTKIAVERTVEAESSLQAQYDAYLAGSAELGANEIYQLGFRLAKRLGHKKIYPVDAKGRSLPSVPDRREFAKENKLTKNLREPYALAQFRLSKRMDEEKMNFTLREHLLLMNHPDMLTASHGIYLQKSLSLSAGNDYPVADGFVSQWYNRNLRIFGNLHGIAEDDDKILAIFGAGHIPLLKHFAESSSEFDVVEVAEVLK